MQRIMKNTHEQRSIKPVISLQFLYLGQNYLGKMPESSW